MNEPRDAELRTRFEQLRDEDHATAPSFRALWGAAELTSRTLRRSRAPALLWLAAAAGVVLAVGVALRRLAPPSGAYVAPAISTWRSPTAGLLRTPGHELLGSLSIRSSILDGAAPAPVQRKGGTP